LFKSRLSHFLISSSFYFNPAHLLELHDLEFSLISLTYFFSRLPNSSCISSSISIF
ncbi:hypothetical protein GIB67_018822, partial [Kingdonia uniflora]